MPAQNKAHSEENIQFLILIPAACPFSIFLFAMF